jgi:hypothetical protein
VEEPSTASKAEVAVIRSVELIVQPDAKDVVGCCPRYRLTSDTGCSSSRSR